MTDDTNHLIDPALLSGEDDGGIPSFLRRDVAPATPHPVFETQENAEGQQELTVQELYDELKPSDDIAMGVLNQMAPQEPIQTMTTYTDPLTAPPADVDNVTYEKITPESNEGAFISNAPSQQEQVYSPGEEATGPQTSNAPADPDEMRRDFFKDINKFGKASGEGASALGRLGLRALRAAADGVINVAKPQGGGKDDATLIYEAYQAMDSKHSEHTAGGAKANASKLRQIIAMGCMTTLSDPVAIGDKMVRIHARMTDAELKPKAIFAALVDVAREQQASDTELTDAAIEECLTKTKADKTLEKEWTAIQKRVEGLITGEASHGLKDDSDIAHKISELVVERVKQYKSDGTRSDRIEQMVEMGYTEAQAEAIVDKKINV